jgi:hypothetical protein
MPHKDDKTLPVKGSGSKLNPGPSLIDIDQEIETEWDGDEEESKVVQLQRRFASNGFRSTLATYLKYLTTGVAVGDIRGIHKIKRFNRLFSSLNTGANYGLKKEVVAYNELLWRLAVDLYPAGLGQ